MDLVASVVREARELERRLLVASETASAKLDRVLGSLLATDDETLASLDKEAQDNAAVGHGFAAMFLLAGVTGMEPIKGQPADEWMAAWRANNKGDWKSLVHKLAGSLPRAYGSAYGGPLFGAAMKISGQNRERAEDLVMTVYMKFLEGAGEHIKPEPIGRAIGYVQLAIKNTGLNVIKKVDKRERSLTRETDEGEIQEEVADDHKLEDLAQDARAKEILDEIKHNSKLKSELEHEHPDAIQYFGLMMDGFTDPEILGVDAHGNQTGKPMLHHPLTKGTSGVPLTPQNWNAKKNKMFGIIKKFFLGGGMHHEASVDYQRAV